jgi:DNA-binding SARP family transcriptional activator/tetratricopeptide (TPR) repeat protein
MAMLSPRRVFFLRTLGTLSIEGGADAAHRSRRALALLAMLAAEGPVGVERDRILAFFWPNSDEERAANSFRQILHGIRRDLADATLIYEGGRLRLNPSVFSVDLWDLERAIRDGQFELADELYRGPFLDGFAVSGLDEFDRWTEATRQRIHQAVSNCVRQLAQRAKDANRSHDAVAHWRRVAALDPLSTTGALGLLNALAAAGDRAGALAYAREYQSLVRSQLEMEPDDEVEQFVDAVRSGGSTVDVNPHAPEISKPTANASSFATIVVDQRRISRPSIPVSSLRRGRLLVGRLARLGAAAKIGIATGLAFVLLGSVRLYGRSAGARQSPDVVAVVPLAPLNGVDSAMSRLMTETLAADVNGAGSLRAVQPVSVIAAVRAVGGTPSSAIDASTLHAIARRLGAGLLVTGEIGTSGSQARVTLSFRDGRDGSAVGSPISVDGDTASILRLIDLAAAQLVGERYRAPSDHLARVAARSTHSIQALKAYLRGQIALDSGQLAEAADAFKQATIEDSTFALAYYRLAIAADWAGRGETSQRARDLAIRFSDHLDAREQRLLSAYAAWRDGRAADAERVYRELLADYSDDSEVWFQLGEVLFHDNPLRGESVIEARPVFERFLQLSPNNVEGIIHLARIAALQGRQQDADALERRAIHLVEDPATLEGRAFRVFALADRPGVKRVTRDLERETTSGTGARTLLSVAIDADDGVAAAAFAQSLVEESVSPSSKAFGLRLLAHMSLARGRWAAAKAELDSAVALEESPSLAQLGEAATLPFVRVTYEELEAIRVRVAAWSPRSDAAWGIENDGAQNFALIRLHALGLLDLRLGDEESARRDAAALDAYTAPVSTRRAAHALAQSIRAHIAAANGRFVEALAELDAADWEGPAHTFAAEAADRYFRGALLAGLGKKQEAARWFRSIAERAAYELPFLMPAREQLANLAKGE